MAQNVFLVVGTKPQTFPAGTVEELYTFSVSKADGTLVSEVATVATGADFFALEAGDYVGSVSKNGVVVTKAFSVANTDITLQVPDTLVVNLG